MEPEINMLKVLTDNIDTLKNFNGFFYYCSLPIL